MDTDSTFTTSLSTNVVVLNKMVYSFMEAVAVETAFLAGNSLVSLLMLIGCMPINVAAVLPKVPDTDEWISLVEASKGKQPNPECKDASETEDDDDDDDDDAEDQDDDGGDEDFSGDEENGDDEEAGPDDVEANGDGGSDDDDDDDEDDDEEDGEDGEEEEDDEDEDEETPQPPLKKRK